MKKVVAAIFLSFLILAIFSFVFLVYIIKFNSREFLAKDLKEKIIRKPYLVNIIGLNEPGDAKYSYFQAKKPINVNIIYKTEVEPDSDAGSWVKEIIKETTGKSADIKYVDYPTYDSFDSYADEELKEMRNDFVFRWDFNPTLYIFYLTKHKEMESNAGFVLNRDAIYIFKDAILELSENNDVQKKLEKSTIMHEWGHLLGLEHLEDDNCIMSERVDVGGGYIPWEEIPTSYCSEALNMLTKVRQMR